MEVHKNQTSLIQLITSFLVPKEFLRRLTLWLTLWKVQIGNRLGDLSIAIAKDQFRQLRIDRR